MVQATDSVFRRRWDGALSGQPQAVEAEELPALPVLVAEHRDDQLHLRAAVVLRERAAHVLERRQAPRAAEAVALSRNPHPKPANPNQIPTLTLKCHL